MSETQMFRVFIKATPEAIWEAITDAEWTQRYGYKGRTDYDLRAGGAVVGHATQEMIDFGAPAIMVKGEVREADAPKKLVHTFHAQFNDDTIAEPGVIVTYLVEADDHGLTRLTVVTDSNGSPITMGFLAGAAETLGEGGGGYPFILSDLKTLLETGKSLQD
ncbi:MAG TPA: SRPBCC domain-containing protein [Acidimicrobiales bacterium]|nr:SRPBCC domain-containing protein [Acidimicrobiales bacterium]